MGIDFSFLVFDARERDPVAARLLRAMDALEVWGHVTSYGLKRHVLVPDAEFEALALRVGLPRALGKEDGDLRMTTQEIRTAIAAFPRPDWLEIGVASPLPLMDVDATPPPQECGLEPAAYALYRAWRGDVRLYAGTQGHHFFEDPLSYSEEANRLAVQITEARSAGNGWKVDLLRREQQELADRNRRERRRLAVSLFEAFATSFGAASVRSYLDHLSAHGPTSSMIYFRDEEAFQANLKSLAAVYEAKSRERKQLPFRAAEGLGSELGAKVREEDFPSVCARLRSLGVEEIRKAVAESPLSAPMAGGFLLANREMLPVGESVATFYAQFVSGK